MFIERRYYWSLAVLLLTSIAASAADVRLIDAVKGGNKPLAQTLIQQRVDVNASEADGTTALHWAVRLQDVQTTDALIRAGAKVGAANRYGVAALYLACLNGNASIAESLLKAGADANSALPDGETVLM